MLFAVFFQLDINRWGDERTVDQFGGIVRQFSEYDDNEVQPLNLNKK